MSKSSCIAMEDNGVFKGIRCQQGGLQQLGNILHTAYQGSAVNKLISAGGLISINPFIPDPSGTAKTFTKLADLRWAFVTCKYTYLWMNNAWMLSILSEGPTEGKFTPLLSSLKKLA